MADPELTIDADGREVGISNPDRVLFAEIGLTKGDLARYYAEVGPVMLRHVADRPMTIVRYPKGLDGEGFFQKNTPDHYPEWIPRLELPKKGGVVTHPVVDHPAVLVYLAQQGMITPHVGLIRRPEIDEPDLFVVDLDPSDDDWAKLVAVAQGTREALEAAGLVTYLQLTGSKGIHVVAPVAAGTTWDAIHRFSSALATLLLERFEDDLTQEFHKEDRGDRIYLDLARNNPASTFVAPYGVRARATAPVATPITWDELDDPELSPQRYTVETVRDRLAEIGDPWADLADSARPLPD